MLISQPMTKEDVEFAMNDEEGIYPKRYGIDFYHRYKEDIALLQKWDLRRSAFLFRGHVFFLMEMMRLQMKMD